MIEMLMLFTFNNKKIKQEKECRPFCFFKPKSSVNILTLKFVHLNKKVKILKDLD